MVLRGAGFNGIGFSLCALETDEAPKEKKCVWRIEHWSSLVVLSAVLTTAAVLGWWSTEVLYVEQVIYSYDSQLHQAQAATAPQK